MPLPLVAGAAMGVGALSEKYGWTWMPNYKDIPTVLNGTDPQVEQNGYSLAKTHLVAEEGRRNDVYRDSLGFLTVGIGHRVTALDNLVFGQRISEASIDNLFKKDIDKAFSAAVKQSKEIKRYNAYMIARLTSVNFQLGTGWINKFPNTWALIKTGDPASVQKAINAITTPKYEGGKPANWAAQTPNRAVAFANILKQQFIG